MLSILNTKMNILIIHQLMEKYLSGWFVKPYTCFDIVLYQKKCPVVFSVKTSLRERYKQADLEAFALRQVYRNSKSFLITLSEEWKSVQEKIDRVNLFALNQCLKADTLQYSEWLKSLKNQIFYPAKKVNPISKGVMIS